MRRLMAGAHGEPGAKLIGSALYSVEVRAVKINMNLPRSIVENEVCISAARKRDKMHRCT